MRRTIDWLINQVDESYDSFIGRESLTHSAEDGDDVAGLIVEKLEDLDEISTGRELVWGAINTLKNVERSIQSILGRLYDMQEDVVQEELFEGAPYIESDAEYEKRVDKIQEDLLSARDLGDD
tara:strand:- start:170 stop:538 length:369 start_codon:yes stop_codon:yes gene_type:complete